MMGNSDNYNFRAALNDNYVIREPFEYQSLYAFGTGLTRHWREWEYIFFYQVYSYFYSIGKFCSKPFTLLVIPVRRCYRFFSSFLEYPYFSHYRSLYRARIFCLNSSRSSSFACPESISEILCNISRSHASSTPPSLGSSKLAIRSCANSARSSSVRAITSVRIRFNASVAIKPPKFSNIAIVALDRAPNNSIKYAPTGPDAPSRRAAYFRR
nr:hypothetical protein [uncultured bacterium]